MDVDTKVFIRLIAKWFLIALSMSASSLMIWYFIKVFVKENKYSITITAIITIVLFVFYVLEHRVAW